MSDTIETASLKWQVQDLQRDISNHQATLALVDKELADKRNEMARLEGHIAKTSDTLSTLSQDVNDFQAKKADLDSQFSIINGRKTEAQNQLQAAIIERDTILSGLEANLANAKVMNTRAIEESNQAVMVAQSNLEQVTHELTTQRSNVAGAKATLETLTTEHEVVKWQIDEAKKEFSNIALSIEALKAEKAKVQSSLEAENAELNDRNVTIKNEIALHVSENNKLKEEFERVQKETFALGEVKVAMDKRESELDAREAKITSLYEKAGVPLPQ